MGAVTRYNMSERLENITSRRLGRLIQQKAALSTPALPRSSLAQVDSKFCMEMTMETIYLESVSTRSHIGNGDDPHFPNTQEISKKLYLKHL